MDTICGTGYKYFWIYLVVFFLALQKWKCVAFLQNSDSTSHRKVVIHVPLQIKHLTRTVVKVVEKPVVKELKHEGEIIHHHHHGGHIEHDHSHKIHSPMSQHEPLRDKENPVYPMAEGTNDINVDTETDLSRWQYQRRRTNQKRVNLMTTPGRSTVRGEAPRNHARRITEHTTTALHRHRPSWQRSKLEDGITDTANFDTGYDSGINDIIGVQSQRQRQRRFHRRPKDHPLPGYSPNGRDSYGLRVLFRQFID